MRTVHACEEVSHRGDCASGAEKPVEMLEQESPTRGNSSLDESQVDAVAMHQR